MQLALDSVDARLEAAFAGLVFSSSHIEIQLLRSLCDLSSIVVV
jgi:hypothetical protein